MHDGELIRLSGVHFGYTGRPELFGGIDLCLHAGDRLGLVGANGSGKTTLLRILVGLEHLQDGSVQAFGQTMRSSRDYDGLRRRVGYLFQDSQDQLFCPTVSEDIAFGPLNLGKSQADVMRTVEDTLERLTLSGLADRISYELSGGEKRLVALATALAMQPDVLLLDEPTSGLDPRSRRDLAKHLAGIRPAQIIASHDMEFVRDTCDRVVVLDGGRIVRDGPTDAVLGDEHLMVQCGLEVPPSLAVEQTRGPHGAGQVPRTRDGESDVDARP